MALADILQWVSQGRKTGTLHITRGAVEKRISFSSGTIHSSWSNDPRESLGQFLVRERLVSEEQLFRTLLRQETEGRPLGALLVENGPAEGRRPHPDARAQGGGDDLRPLPLDGRSLRIQGRGNPEGRAIPGRSRRHQRHHGRRPPDRRVGADARSDSLHRIDAQGPRPARGSGGPRGPAALFRREDGHRDRFRGATHRLRRHGDALRDAPPRPHRSREAGSVDGLGGDGGPHSARPRSGSEGHGRWTTTTPRSRTSRAS